MGKILILHTLSLILIAKGKRVSKKNLLELNGIGFSYYTQGKERVILDDFSLSFEEGSITCLMGASGCGKSTLLDIIGGYKGINNGEIKFSDAINTCDEIGMVFQKNVLLPWKNVYENLDFPLKVKAISRAKRRELIQEMLNRFGLAEIQKYYPNQLSGGMHARIALLRTLIIEPQLILADEAFSALDMSTKKSIWQIFVDEVRENQKTAIVVTHDISEALSIGDRMILFAGNPLKILFDVNTQVLDNAQKDRIRDKYARFVSLLGKKDVHESA